MAANLADSSPTDSASAFRRFSRVAIALPLLTFILITLGGIVRISNAGLACPDWPLCHGQLIPPMDPLVLIEWTHRLVAGTLGLIILGQLIWALAVPALRRHLGGLAGLALGLYLSQAILGGLTVLHLLDAPIVNLHLANGLALFATLIVIALRAVRLSTPHPSPLPEGEGIWGGEGTKGLFYLSLFTALVVYLQAALGGGVSSNYAGMACPDFPTCQGMWLPPLVGHVGLQVAHRIGAFLTLFVVGWLHLAALRGPSQARIASRLAFLLVLVQIGLGIANVLTKLDSMPMRAAHLATAAAMLAMVVVTAYALRPRRVEQAVAQPALQEAHAS